MTIAEHAFLIAFHAAEVFVGVTGAAIGGIQVARTLQLGPLATNADDVIRRSGITIGVGAAFLFAAFAR